MKVRFKRLCDDAVIPSKAHPSDAGFDLTAVSKSVDGDGNIVYGFGIALEIPEGYVGLIFPRSSIARQDLLLSNSVGVIDAHYRGEITAKFKRCLKIHDYGFGNRAESRASRYKEYEIGDRIAQLVIVPIPDIELVESGELSATDRGTGGYGSTGK